MLQAMTWASPPDLRMPSATTSQASALRLEITTLAPSFAKSSAEARPMPRLDPVTTATLPVRSNGVFFIGYLPGYDTRHSGARAFARTRKLEVISSNFRVRCFASPRNDGCLLNQPARIRHPAQMIVGVAKGVLDHGQPLEVVADPGFLGHADAAMELDRLLADEFARFADLHFRRRHRGGALFGVVEI